MLKIVVFDGGWGGEVVANYLRSQLSVVDIVRAIDWNHAPYDNIDLAKVREYTEECLLEYIGRVDLIVLGGYTVATTLDFLRLKYPQQKFTSVGVNYYRVLRASKYPDRVTVIMNETLKGTDFCEELRDNLPFSTLALPDCSGWEELANTGELSREIIYGDLSPYFVVKPRGLVDGLSCNKKKRQAMSLLEIIKEEQNYQKQLQNYIPPQPAVEDFVPLHSDVVLILNTNFWENKVDLEAIFGYKVRVLDFRQKLLHDTCMALGLLGVDGKRSK